MKEDKNLELERLVFFSDAIVAIAITLLAFNLKIEKADNEHLTYSDLLDAWPKFIAFFLSFFNIALFWKIHHKFFTHIKTIDSKLLWFNIGWLMFIVMLPFSTSLISSHFADVPAMFFYCLNIFFITVFQNIIWDNAALRPDFLKEKIDELTVHNYVVDCNVAMVNSLLAVIISFFKPSVAFIILFLRLPMILIAHKIFRLKKQ
jgi:uncharacterized membrane protein